MFGCLRKILIWIVGIPLLGLLFCLETIGSVIASLGMIILKGLSIFMIAASLIVVLVGIMPFGKDVIITMIVAVVLFWLSELLVAILAVSFTIQKTIWGKMTE